MASRGYVPGSPLLIRTPEEIAARQCLKFPLVGDNRIFGEMSHLKPPLIDGIGLTGHAAIVLIEQQKRSAQPQA